MHTSAHTWNLELKATIFKATQEEIQQQVDEKSADNHKKSALRIIYSDIVFILSLFFVAVEVKVRNITKHLPLSPNVS